ncbi:MAG: LysM peptidoglycan-binding domain-containing protein [Candidatus Methylacidiphilales bacterium]
MVSRKSFLRTVALGAGACWAPGLVSEIFAAQERYVVQRGDTLWGISQKTGTSVDALKRLNQLSNNNLQIGRELILSKPEISTSSMKVNTPSTDRIYVVKPGDNLAKIAGLHRVEVSALRDHNRLKSDLIRVGDRLKIPGVGSVATPAVPAKPTPLFVRRVQRQINVSNFAERRWKHIILHHSGTPTGNGKIFDYYHRRVRRMENGLAYHFVIGNGSDSDDGEIEVSERWSKQIQGGHVRSEAYNQNSIGICLVGDFQKSKPTNRQMRASLELIDHLKNGMLKKRAGLLLHRDIQDTICPGRFFPEKEIHRVFA